MSIKQNIKVKTFTGSGSINFEEDRKESLGEVDNANAARHAGEKLIGGSKHGNIYKLLEKRKKEIREKPENRELVEEKNQKNKKEGF